MTGVRRLQVGDWRVAPDLNRVTGPAGDVLLMPKAMAVLVYLAERPGQVVSTDELVEAIWHGRPMGDNPVYKCITQLRTVLGDDRKVPSYIATVHTKGYRLIAPVDWHDADVFSDAEMPAPGATETVRRPSRRSLFLWTGGITAVCLLVAFLSFDRDAIDGAGAAIGPTAMAEQPSIAVLPFANMSPGPGQDYFADGLSEELIAQLANVPGLRVIGRTSSFAFKGKNGDLRMIGRTLGVNHVLEGSVRKADDRVRVTAQLINPADGSHLWSQSYDRNLDDVFTIQDEIARTVASALRISIAARIVRRGGTASFEAYDAFLAGRSAAEAGGAYNVLASIAAFERAVAIDPGFIAAWGALAQAFQLASIDVPQQRAEWLQKLAITEDRILMLAPNWPAAIHTAARREMSTGNLVEAERLFNSLRELPPGYGAHYVSHGVFLLNVGRPRDAINHFMRDLQVEPLALSPSLWLQIAYELASEPAKADLEYQRALGFSDDTRALQTMALIRAIGRRDLVAIRQELTAQIATSPLTRPLNEAMLRNLDAPSSALAELRQYADDPVNVSSSVVVMMMSAWAVYFGNPELALETISKRPPFADHAFDWTVWRPAQRDMRGLPDFKALVRARRLDEYWRASGNWGDYCRPVGPDDFECDENPTGM